MDLFWRLRNPFAGSKPDYVAKATYADDDDSGLLSMIVTHKSKNLKELSKCQTLAVKGFYNYDDNTKLFFEFDPLCRQMHRVGVKLRQVTLADQTFMSEFSYAPDKDAASAKLEFDIEKNAKVAATFSFAKFKKDVFANHTEAIELKAKVRPDTKISARYDLQKSTLKAKAAYTRKQFLFEAETTATSANIASKTLLRAERNLSAGTKMSLAANLDAKRGMLEYKSRADNLPFSLAADFPFEAASRRDIVDNTTITFKTRINVFNN